MKVGFHIAVCMLNTVIAQCRFAFIALILSIAWEAMAQNTFNPKNPEEPNGSKKYRLFVEANPEASCRFNISSGDKIIAGSDVKLMVIPYSGYIFYGWYEGDVLLSSATTFTYTMPSRHATLTAKLVFFPSNPDDPGTTQEDVDNYAMGDVNHDGDVSLTDVTMLANYILGVGSDGIYLENADMNLDSEYGVTDILMIVNFILGE